MTDLQNLFGLLGEWVTVTEPHGSHTVWHGRLTSVMDQPTISLDLPGGGSRHLPAAFRVEAAQPPVPEPGERDAGPGRPFADLCTEGLLWLINRTVFHPQGLALALHIGDDGQATGWSLKRTDDGEPWQYDQTTDWDGQQRARRTLGQAREPADDVPADPEAAEPLLCAMCRFNPVGRHRIRGEAYCDDCVSCRCGQPQCVRAHPAAPPAPVCLRCAVRPGVLLVAGKAVCCACSSSPCTGDVCVHTNNVDGCCVSIWLTALGWVRCSVKGDHPAHWGARHGSRFSWPPRNPAPVADARPDEASGHADAPSGRLRALPAIIPVTSTDARPETRPDTGEDLGPDAGAGARPDAASGPMGNTSGAACPDVRTVIADIVDQAVNPLLHPEPCDCGQRTPLLSVDPAGGHWHASPVAVSPAEWGRCHDRADRAEARLRLARQALAEDGYFKPEEIGPDIAPRISELADHLRGRITTLENRLTATPQPDESSTADDDLVQRNPDAQLRALVQEGYTEDSAFHIVHATVPAAEHSALLDAHIGLQRHADRVSKILRTALGVFTEDGVEEQPDVLTASIHRATIDRWSAHLTAPPGLALTFPQVQGACPACGHAGLFLGSGGFLTCAQLTCPNPSAADELLDHDRVRDLTGPHCARLACTRTWQDLTLARKHYDALRAQVISAWKYINHQQVRGILTRDSRANVLTTLTGWIHDPGPLSTPRAAR